jgi:Tfp pilus assembly protein PilN
MSRKHLNFIPKELRPRIEVPHELVPVFFVALAFLYVLMGPVKISILTRMNQKELAGLQTIQEDLGKKAQSLSEQNKLAEQNTESFKSIQKVLGRKNYWSEIFKEMSMLIPDGVWLTNFTNQTSKGTGKTAEQLLVRGEAISPMHVVKFLTVLEKSHFFAGARMISSEKVKDMKPAKFKFEFTIPVHANTGGKG